MKLAEIIHAEKKAIKQSKWRDDLPKKQDFPLSWAKGNAFPLTKMWRWTTTSFTARERRFIALTAYHRKVPEYQAVLAERLANDSRIIARVEYHARHPVLGWHVHASSCDDVNNIQVGSVKPLGQQRLPGVHSRHRRSKYCLHADTMDDNIALELAMKWFGVPHTSDLLATAEVQ